MSNRLCLMDNGQLIIDNCCICQLKDFIVFNFNKDMNAIAGLNHLNLAVSNLKVSFNFYTRKLNFKPLAKWKHGAYFLAGDLWFTLSFNPNYPPEARTDYTHYAFSVSKADLDYYHQNIERLNLKLWQENTSEGNSLYILDPDNHKLELHVGDWQTRLEAVKKNPYEDMVFYV